MNIIKLDATASTNTYLKNLLTTCDLENFTTVVTENQFAGRGQRGSDWLSEAGSNLIFSVLLKTTPVSMQGIFDLNVMVALAVIHALKKMYNLPFFVKWPNDILSCNKKIGGILIENILKSQGNVCSIVGIGINGNQQHFPKMSKASSLGILTGGVINKEELLQSILSELVTGFAVLEAGDVDVLWEQYKACLFRKDVVSVFEIPEGKRFNGIIRDVTRHGKLVVETEEESMVSFALKEVQLLY